MSTTRQKIKQQEKHIRNLLRTNKAPDSSEQIAWQKTLEYYAVKDALEGTNHWSLIKYIYTDRWSVHDTQFALSQKLCLSERSLFRYRKKYIECFYFFYNKETSIAK